MTRTCQGFHEIRQSPGVTARVGPFFYQKKDVGYGARDLQPTPAEPRIVREKAPAVRAVLRFAFEGLLCARCLTQFL